MHAGGFAAFRERLRTLMYVCTAPFAVEKAKS